MKLPLFAIALVTSAASVFAAPSMTVDQAIAVANKHLKERAPGGGFYITSVKLESLTTTYRWSVDWSGPVPIDEVKKETGIEIAMDGSIISLVKGPQNVDPRTGKFDPNGSTGLQSPRTRTARPSILDLKH